MLKIFFASFSVNLFTSVDDAITRIPVLTAATRTRSGRLAFTVGNLLAVVLAIILAYGLSQVLTVVPGGNTTIAMFVLLLAGVVYFDLLALKPPKRIEAEIYHSQLSPTRHRKLIGLGFIMTFLTMIDDMFALAPFFLEGTKTSLVAIAGIVSSSLLLALGVLFFAAKLNAIPHKRLLATGTLIVFAGLLFFGVI